MVNYCIVAGCGRNNKIQKHLQFFSLPKDTDRQKEWLEAVGRKDILKKSPEKRVTYRVCSRHFTRADLKNKHLCGDAVPTLNLPGCDDEDDLSLDYLDHESIICNNCSNSIHGFRYKCIICPDYDLCSTCEVLETHSEHYMIRMPKPLKFKAEEDIVKKFRKFFNEKVSDALNTINTDNDSSDDEPITKYAKKNEIKNYDSGIDLSDDIKDTISREVDRVLSIQFNESDIKDKNKKKLKTKNELSMARKRAGTMTTNSDVSMLNKKQKVEDANIISEMQQVPEVAFADVNVIDNQVMDVKPSSSSTFGQTDTGPTPVMHMKLSDDFTQLMIVMNDQETTYKF